MPSSRRLAMCGAVENHQTPQTRVSGLESAAHVRGLGKGDQIEMVIQHQGGESTTITLFEGRNPLTPHGWVTYCVRKIAGLVPHATTVEIILDG